MGREKLIEFMIHEAAHACVGGHDTTALGGRTCDVCGRPDSKKIGEAFAECLNK